MTNRPKFNFDTFDEVAGHLRALGWTVFNPHEHDLETFPNIDDAEATKTGDVAALVTEIGFSYAGAMTWDFSRVIEADTIVLLPEWETSSGAKGERYVAEMTGTTVYLAVKTETGWKISPDPVQKRMAVSIVE
jgi:hypothetical protein